MAWELPSKPIYLDEELRDSYEMGQLPLLHRNDKNVTKVQYVLPSKKYTSNTANRIDSNYYYTNIPKEKFSYEKNQYQSSPYYQSGNKPLSYSVPNNLQQTSSSNQLQHYVSYADSLMKQFKKLTEKIPQDRPLSTKDFQEFANMWVFFVVVIWDICSIWFFRTTTKNFQSIYNCKYFFAFFFHILIFFFFICFQYSIADNVKANSKLNEKYRQRTNYAHIIHPVFRKRSIDKMTPLDKFDLKLHRNSRHALYKQINTFLKTYIYTSFLFQSSYSKCTRRRKKTLILRFNFVGRAVMAINVFWKCYVKPLNTNIMKSPEVWLLNYFELFLRTCFKKFFQFYFSKNLLFFLLYRYQFQTFLFRLYSLPEPTEPTTHPEHKRYDEAHASTADCQQLYPNCKESVWNSKYM